MTDETGSPGGDAIADLPADAPEAFDTPKAAADYFASLVDKRNKTPAESAPEATADNELSVEDNAGPEEVPGEAQEVDPAELPPVEPPRSWTKEAKDRWNTIPREAQEEFARIEQGREREFLRSQQDAAEKLKGLTAKEQQAEQARQQYEAKLSSSVKIIETALQADFGDIQTMQHVRDLQNNDPFRFQAWQVRQMELTAAKAEESAVTQRQAHEKQSKRATYEVEQNNRLIELVPEMGDPKKAADLRERAIKMLNDDLGLSTDQLTQWMQDDTGHQILSNAGMQKLMADGLKYREIVNAPKAVAAKPLPPVARPGTSRPSGQGVDSERIQALNRKPELTTKEATELYTLQQRSQRRA